MYNNKTIPGPQSKPTGSTGPPSPGAWVSCFRVSLVKGLAPYLSSLPRLVIQTLDIGALVDDALVDAGVLVRHRGALYHKDGVGVGDGDDDVGVGGSPDPSSSDEGLTRSRSSLLAAERHYIEAAQMFGHEAALLRDKLHRATTRYLKLLELLKTLDQEFAVDLDKEVADLNLGAMETPWLVDLPGRDR